MPISEKLFDLLVSIFLVILAAVIAYKLLDPSTTKINEAKIESLLARIERLERRLERLEDERPKHDTDIERRLTRLESAHRNETHQTPDPTDSDDLNQSQPPARKNAP